jgi:endo-1,4-beta-xylanase
MINSLKHAWKHSFRIGAAISGKILEQKEADEILSQHFSSVTAENAMKFINIQPEENVWNWEEADKIADYARQKGLALRGHTILWHNQVPPWVFLSGRAENEPVSKTELFKRLENYIIAITARYNDTVNVWDVLNEVIDVDKGDENSFRLSPWYCIGTSELYEFAFKRMKEASPGSRLFYNDYNIEHGEKLEASIVFLSKLLDAGIPVHGVGLQGHWYYNYPDAEIIGKAIERFSSLGLDIEFTEVDFSAYDYNDKRNGEDAFSSMPHDRLLQQAERYRELFRVAAQYPMVKNITTWGIADNHTWLDNFPVPNRKNWPLLFDTEYQQKEVVSELINMGLCLGD